MGAPPDMQMDRGSSPPAPASERTDFPVAREHPRVPCEAHATLTLGGGPITVETGNISYGGVLVRGDGTFAMGAEGLLCFRDHHADVEFDVRVCWVRGDEAGLKFMARSRKQRQAISAMVDGAG